MAGFFLIAAVDSDETGMKTYRRNFPDTYVMIKDIRQVDGKQLLREIGISGDKVDVLLGGPPCQGFSVVGRIKIASLVREGKWKLNNGNPNLVDDPRNLLYKEFVRLLKEIQPDFFVMENVPGIKSYMNGEFIKEILRSFERAGYRTEFRVLNAVNYGVPQTRKRGFFIGNRLGYRNPFPRETHYLPDSKQDEDRDGRQQRAINVWEAIGDLPPLRAGEGHNPMSYTKDPFCEYQRWARKTSKAVFNHVSRHHSPRDIAAFRIMKPGSRWKDLPQEIKAMYGYRDDIFTDKFKRLWKNKPAWTITSHLQKDGYLYIHPTQVRTITVREAARLQSFPDTFVFEGAKVEQFKQVGNAVPPLLAKVIAEEIKKML